MLFFLIRLERGGWTAVESKGVTLLPTFGELRYEPLDPTMKSRLKVLEICCLNACCACYPYEDEEETLASSYNYAFVNTHSIGAGTGTGTGTEMPSYGESMSLRSPTSRRVS